MTSDCRRQGPQGQVCRKKCGKLQAELEKVAKASLFGFVFHGCGHIRRLCFTTVDERPNIRSTRLCTIATNFRAHGATLTTFCLTANYKQTSTCACTIAARTSSTAAGTEFRRPATAHGWGPAIGRYWPSCEEQRPCLKS